MHLAAPKLKLDVYDTRNPRGVCCRLAMICRIYYPIAIIHDEVGSQHNSSSSRSSSDGGGSGGGGSSPHQRSLVVVVFYLFFICMLRRDLHSASFLFSMQYLVRTRKVCVVHGEGANKAPNNA